MIKGNAELHFNEATAIRAFQEYLDKRTTSIGHVLVKSVGQSGAGQTFVVKVAEEAVNESFQIQRETS